MESGGRVTGTYTVTTAVVDPDPESYSGTITGSFSAASHPDPVLGLMHPASVRLDAAIDFGGGIEARCIYDARLSDSLDTMRGTIRCQLGGLVSVTRTGALLMEKSWSGL